MANLCWLSGPSEAIDLLAHSPDRPLGEHGPVSCGGKVTAGGHGGDRAAGIDRAVRAHFVVWYSFGTMAELAELGVCMHEQGASSGRTRLVGVVWYTRVLLAVTDSGTVCNMVTDSGTFWDGVSEALSCKRQSGANLVPETPADPGLTSLH